MGADKTNVSSRPSIAYPAQVQLTDRESFLMKRRHMSRSVAGVRSTLSRMTGRYNARSVIRGSQIDKTSNGIHNVVEIAIGFGRPLTELTASDKVDFRSAARLALIDLMQESLPALEENDVVQDSLEIGTRTVYVASFQSGSVSRMVADVVSEAIVDAPIEILVGKRNYVSDGQRVESSGKVDSPPPPLPPPEEADEPERPPFPQSQPTTVGSEFAGHHDDDELPETPLPEHPEDYDESENELPPSPTRLSRRKESEIPTPHDNDGYVVCRNLPIQSNYSLPLDETHRTETSGTWSSEVQPWIKISTLRKNVLTRAQQDANVRWHATLGVNFVNSISAHFVATQSPAILQRATIATGDTRTWSGVHTKHLLGLVAFAMNLHSGVMIAARVTNAQLVTTTRPSLHPNVHRALNTFEPQSPKKITFKLVKMTTSQMRSLTAGMQLLSRAACCVI